MDQASNDEADTPVRPDTGDVVGQARFLGVTMVLSCRLGQRASLAGPSVQNFVFTSVGVCLTLSQKLIHEVELSSPIH